MYTSIVTEHAWQADICMCNVLELVQQGRMVRWGAIRGRCDGASGSSGDLDHTRYLESRLCHLPDIPFLSLESIDHPFQHLLSLILTSPARSCLLSYCRSGSDVDIDTSRGE